MPKHVDGITTITPHAEGFRLQLRTTQTGSEQQEPVGEYHLTPQAFEILEAALFKAKAEAQTVRT